MPTYDYQCGSCNKSMEIFHSIREERKKCPLCGSLKLKRLIGPGSGFLFRGSGFYITDYRSSDYQSKAKAESETPKPSEKTSGEDGASKATKPKEKQKNSAKAS